MSKQYAEEKEALKAAIREAVKDSLEALCEEAGEAVSDSELSDSYVLAVVKESFCLCMRTLKNGDLAVTGFLSFGEYPDCCDETDLFSLIKDSYEHEGTTSLQIRKLIKQLTDMVEGK